MKTIKILPLIIAILFSGCSVVTQRGKKIDYNQFQNIVKNQTTKSEIIQKFGEPIEKSLLPSGQVKWIYWYIDGVVEYSFWNKRNSSFTYSGSKAEVLFEDDIVTDFIVTALSDLKMERNNEIEVLTPVDFNKIKDIIKGKTSQEDIKDLFGPPHDVAIYADHKQIWKYNSSIESSSKTILNTSMSTDHLDAKLEILFDEDIVRDYLFYKGNYTGFVD